ncbi:sensor histidine kinase [Paenisporosarcina sp. TG20]|uniref:sensor histidine kinase n=1 Tax=Paenisporosarcina sp. TG20 TaxID=1211706 RepID=UPI0002EC4CEE|nr:ATP-binding protein [Paenisporosarcina sp. TG20]
MWRVNKVYSLLRKNPSSKLRLVFLYRYISLVLTSVFYLIGPQSPFIFKIGVVVSLGVAAWILTDLQRRYSGNNRILKAIVLTETIGLTLLLIPTGGIASPFIWYALNPVLIAASFLTPLFCWGTLTFYLGSATLIAYPLFRIENMIILEEKSYFYLVCILTTLLARLFSGLTKELDSKATLLNVQQDELLLVNKKLIETNVKYQERLEHIMSLYHLMQNFSSKRSAEGIIKEITTSLLKSTQSEEAFFWLTDLNHHNSHLINTTNNGELEDVLKNEWKTIRGRKEPFVWKINNEIYWMKMIRTSNNVGVLGVKVFSSSEESKPFLLNSTLDFLAELSEIMLERIHMDQMMGQMIVIEEQNRIANEIHDSVSQRLFGMVYSLHSLKVKSHNISKDELQQEYQFLSQTANTTMKELRAAIYRLSSVKKGEQPFIVRLKKYLDDYGKLNVITINYHITGDESFITNKLKNELYRISCEACGNAVRHGDCHVIDLRLSLSEEKTILVIQDDGIGISPSIDGEKRGKGIGLFNMQSIVSSFSGTFSIDGIQGSGTKIQIEIPNIKMLKTQKAVG